MRLFVALDIEPEIRKRIADFRSQMKAFAPEVRWVGPETFHVTLQFLGETTKLDQIQSALGQVKSSPVPLTFRGTGFFPKPKAPRVFWVGIESDQHLQELVNSIAEQLAAPGIRARVRTLQASSDTGAFGKWEAAPGCRESGQPLVCSTCESN